MGAGESENENEGEEKKERDWMKMHTSEQPVPRHHRNPSLEATSGVCACVSMFMMIWMVGLLASMQCTLHYHRLAILQWLLTKKKNLEKKRCRLQVSAHMSVCGQW